jgi:4-amino-4-deoxy-L-arabinose transferase-like glycosyltransferase
MALFGFSASRGGFREWRQWHPEGILISLGVALPWYVAVGFENGQEFIQTFLIDHNLQRFTTTVHGHERPFNFYGPSLLMLTFPWTFLLIPRLRRALEHTDWILLWWALVPVVFFSFSGSKLPGYILPAVPAIALLCAKAIVPESSRSFRVGVFIESGTMLFIGVALGFFGHLLDVDPHVNGYLIAAVTFSLAALLVVVALWLKPPLLAALNLAALTAIVVIATNFILPRFDVMDTMRPWNHALEGIVSDGQTVYLYKPPRWSFYGMQYYRNNRIHAIDSPEELLKLTEKSPGLFLITDDRTLSELGQLTELKLEIVRTLGRHTGLWARRAY